MEDRLNTPSNTISPEEELELGKLVATRIMEARGPLSPAEQKEIDAKVDDFIAAALADNKK